MNCIKLNLDYNPLVENFKFPEKIGEKGHPSYINISISNIKPELLELFKQYNIEMSYAVLFCKKSQAINPIHSDIISTKAGWEKWCCAVNWNLTLADSIMTWFETTEKEIYPYYFYNNSYYLSGIHYKFRDNKEVNSDKTKIIETQKISNPCLVRTDIPHQVKNLDTKDRWALSLRPKINYSWDKAVEIFSPLFL